MANNLPTRIANLEAKQLVREQQLSPDFQVALDYWGSNGCRTDIQPPADWTPAEIAALSEIFRIMAELEEAY